MRTKAPAALTIAVLLALFAYALGLEVVDRSLVSATLNLRLLTIGPGRMTGIEPLLPSGEAGVAFVTLLLALATAYLALETRRVAAETRRLAGTTQTEIDLLTRQTSALTRQADAMDAQLAEMRANAEAAIAPRFLWRIGDVDAVPHGPQGRQVFMQLILTNLGAPAIMGDAHLDGHGTVDSDQNEKGVPTSGTYDLQVRVGPFTVGRPFVEAVTLMQQYRPLPSPRQLETRAAICVAGRGAFFNDWSADVMTVDTKEAEAAVASFVERLRRRWQPMQLGSEP